jgi:hypothetical protein
MALSKKAYKWIFIIAFVAVVGGVALYFILRDEPVEDPNKNNEPVPPGSSSAQWIPEDWPLRKGMFGPLIKAMQKKLGIGDDGKFGTITESSVKNKIGKTEVTEYDYKLLVPESKAVSGDIGKQARAKFDYTLVYFENGPMDVNNIAATKNLDQVVGLVTGTRDNNFLIQGGLVVPKSKVYLITV